MLRTLGVFAPPVFPVPHWEEQPKGTGTEHGVCSLNIGFHVENGLMKVERLILINLLIIKGFPTLFFPWMQSSALYPTMNSFGNCSYRISRILTGF